MVFTPRTTARECLASWPSPSSVRAVTLDVVKIVAAPAFFGGFATVSVVESKTILTREGRLEVRHGLAVALRFQIIWTRYQME
jgi:hypothetical protein